MQDNMHAVLPKTEWQELPEQVELPQEMVAAIINTPELQAYVLDSMCRDIHESNVKVGWWDAADNPLVVPTKIALIISECAEALEGHRKGLKDDKLVDEDMVGVELADVLIRVFDLCGFLGVDVGTLLAKKAAFNATRADHKPENRAALGGKKY